MPPEVELEHIAGKLQRLTLEEDEEEEETESGSGSGSDPGDDQQAEAVGNASAGPLELRGVTKVKKAPSVVRGIPEKYVNAFGFIAYTHKGQLPWKTGEINLPSDVTGATQILAIDCEMVGVGQLHDSELGRVSIVNEHGICIYDTFVKPEVPVTMYRSDKSGIYPEDIEDAPPLPVVLEEVQKLVKGKTLVGQSIHNDLKVLRLMDHPSLRDTAVFFKNKHGKSATPSLKSLVKQYFKVDIQSGDHSSIEDAQATLKLYLRFKGEWEKDIVEKHRNANLPSMDSLASAVAKNIISISDMHIQPRESDLRVDSDMVFLRANKIMGSYVSSSEYLDVQFRLLLEDLLRPLRFGVNAVLKKGHRRVKINSLFRGVKVDVERGVKEMEVKRTVTLRVPVVPNNLGDIDWETSKMFMRGSLLLVSPDNFKTVKFALIQRGPDLKAAEWFQHILKVDVFFYPDGPTWVINDTDKSNNFIMMESPAFYEAYRHTLAYLQKMPLDKFPLKPYIVDAVTVPSLPKVMKQFGMKNVMDFGVWTGLDHPKRFGVPLDQLTWPTATDTGFDVSQYDALRNIFTQELTIIQGPPGTGKTFIGVNALKFLLTNDWYRQSSPVLVVSYTNHALDQTLEKLLAFITEQMCGGVEVKARYLILRIGGGSKSDIVMPLTLKAKLEAFEEKIIIKRRIELQKAFLQHMKSNMTNLQPGLVNFLKFPAPVITALEKGSPKLWTNWKKIGISIAGDPLKWFGIADMGLPASHNLRKQTTAKYKTNKKAQPPFYYFEFEGLANMVRARHPEYYVDLDSRVESMILSPDAASLTGQSVGLTGDVFAKRWACYFALLSFASLAIEEVKRDLAKNEALMEAMCDILSPKDIKEKALILGMTTTGAVKYKKEIVGKLKPKIMFVEEAAHVLEPHVVASLTEDCEQMIMIGDHQQLRPMTADYDLSSKYSFDVSLMERLVRNGISQNRQNWIQLTNQHRMRPEIAKMVCPVIYKELYNHPSVALYPPVNGCKKNIFFVDHRQFEEKEKGASSFHNKYEAEYVKSLVQYFVSICGYETSKITVIATYLAQKELIEKKLEALVIGKQDPVRVSTVDGYQGEENDIVILSLVRSNDKSNIGFLKTDNRVCVALSRARHGFFMIGNMPCLKAASGTWASISNTLTETGSIGPVLPVTNITPHSFFPVAPKVLKIPPPSRRKAKSRKAKNQRAGASSQSSSVNDGNGNNTVCGKTFKCGHQCKIAHGPKDLSKHRCLSNCQRLCPNGLHSCPGRHACFMSCNFAQGSYPCKGVVNLKYSCDPGHGSFKTTCSTYSMIMRGFSQADRIKFETMKCYCCRKAETEDLLAPKTIPYACGHGSIQTTQGNYIKNQKSLDKIPCHNCGPAMAKAKKNGETANLEGNNNGLVKVRFLCGHGHGFLTTHKKDYNKNKNSLNITLCDNCVKATSKNNGNVQQGSTSPISNSPASDKSAEVTVPFICGHGSITTSRANYKKNKRSLDNNFCGKCDTFNLQEGSASSNSMSHESSKSDDNAQLNVPFVCGHGSITTSRANYKKNQKSLDKTLCSKCQLAIAQENRGTA